MNRKIDHLVYATTNFEDSIEWFEDISGVRPVFGGYHKAKGTKNALVRIGDKMYLEILGIDESNDSIKKNRWMGIDLLTKPQLTRWALASDNLEKDASCLKSYDQHLGEIKAGSRKKQNGNTLAWEMIMPLAKPAIDLLPFMIDWGKSVHPAQNLNAACKLKCLNFCHPKALEIEQIFKKLGLNLEIKKAEEASIKAVINCPKGIIEL